MPITQAGKTIIFEKFADRKYVDGKIPDRLDFMLGNSPTPQDIADIEKNLSVSRFDEFLKKFQPVIYEKMVRDPNSPDGVVFVYSLEEPSKPYKIINITNEQFYKMASDLYDKKGSSGNTNLDFNYEEIQEMLTPKKTVNSAKQLRQKLEYNVNKFEEKKERYPEDAKKHKRAIKEILQEIDDTFYKSGSMLTLLTFGLDDFQRKIDYIDNSAKALGYSGKDSDQPPQLIECDITFDDDGNIEIKDVPAVKQNDEDVKRLTSSQAELLRIVEKDYDKHSPEDMKSSEFGKKLVLSTFCGTQYGQALPARSELVKKRDQYARIYKTCQESFAKQMISLVEKFLNVKAFFEHASETGKIKPSVIIANCTISDLMESGIKENFVKYINWVGGEHTDNKVWYAIVPALKHPDFMDDDDDDESLELDFDESEDESNNKYGLDLSTFEEFKSFIGLMKDSKIVTFFNFKGNETTGFSNLKANIINRYKQECEKINDECKDYTVFCYPNFTLLPKSKKRSAFCKVSCESEIVVEGDITYEKNEEDLYLDSPSIYLDSSYIACAMMIYAHNNKILKDKGFPVSSDFDYPAVRFDYEGSFVLRNKRTAEPCWKIITTKMNREYAYSMPKDVKEAIGNFGFCFGSDEVKVDEKAIIKNTYVMCARTLKQESVKRYDGSSMTQYRPIYKTILKVFLNMVYTLYQDLGNFKSEVHRWEQTNNKKYINNPLFDLNYGEGVSGERIEINEPHIQIVYGRNSDDSEIEITDTTD